MARIWDEKFEGTGYEEVWSLGETITGGGSSLDEDYDTSLHANTPATWGSHCLRVAISGGGTSFVAHDFGSPLTIVHIRDEFIWDSESITTPPAGGGFLFAMLNSSLQLVFSTKVEEVTEGVYRLVHAHAHNGSFNETNGASISLDTPYRLEVKWDTVADQYEFRLNDVLDISGSMTASHRVPQILRLGISGTAPGTSQVHLHDNVAIDTTDWVGAEAGGGGGSFPPLLRSFDPAYLRI